MRSISPPVPDRVRGGLGRRGGCLVALLAVQGSAALLAAPPALSFAGGPAGGFYQEVAEGVAREVPGVQALDTAGSVENLELLEAGRVRFALAQQDVVSEHLTEMEARGERSRIRGMGQVFFDYLHIFVRAPLHVEQAAEFRRFLIWPGEEGSGTRQTAVRFLESVGVPLSSLARPALRLEDLAAEQPGARVADIASRLPELFGSDKLDLAMIMGLPGSDRPCRVMASGRATLYPLDYRTLRILTAEEEGMALRRQVVIANLPAATYANQPRSVPTVAVPVLLLARDGEDPRIAAQVLEAARRRWDNVAGKVGEAGCRRLEELPSAGSTAMAQLDLLPGFEPREGPLAAYGLPALLALLALGVIGGGAWLWRSGWLREGWSILRQEKMAARILGGLALSVVAITFLTYLLEHRINEHFSTPWESAWSIIIYLFSGLEDRNPYTPAGRLVAALGLVLGPVFFAFLTGWLAGVFIRWEKRMPQNLRDHYLILNWSDRAVGIIRELHHPVIREAKGVSVVVVLADDESLDLRKVKEAGSGQDDLFEDFYLSVGDPTSERALLNANAQDAETIVILADVRLGEHADQRSIRSLFMLRRIALAEQEKARHRVFSSQAKKPRPLHVIVEVVDGANVPILEEIASTFPGTLEWVAGLDVRTRLLAQAVLSKGVVGFYSDLLRVSRDTSEIYTVPVTDSEVGDSFRAVASRLLAAELPRDPKDGETNPAIPVGVQREEEGRYRIYTNPRPDAPGWILQKGDQLVLLAYEQPGPPAR